MVAWHRTVYRYNMYRRNAAACASPTTCGRRNTLRRLTGTLGCELCFRSEEVRPRRACVVAFLDEGDHAGERAPVIELGA